MDEPTAGRAETPQEYGERVGRIVRSLEAGQEWMNENGERIRIVQPGYDYVMVADLVSGQQRRVQPTHFGVTYRRSVSDA